jgi:enamine deaminase RidA (YjgF/YER057c/UK114 family)
MNLQSQGLQPDLFGGHVEIVSLPSVRLNLPSAEPTRMRYFGPATPTSTTVQISRLADPDAMVEIEAIAVIDG